MLGRALPCLVAVVLAVAACGSDGDTVENGDGGPVSAEELIAAAQEEGQLVWYTSVPEAIIENVVQGFEEEYGISVDYLRLVDGQLSQRFASEQQSGAPQADFMNVANRSFFTAANQEGWFATVSADDVPTLAEWPAEYLFDDTYALLNVQPLGFAYNTRTSSASPEDWPDLLDPAFGDGRTLFGDPVIPAYLGLYDYLDRTYGTEYLEGLDGLDFRVIDSMVPGAQQLAAGEADMTVPALASVVQPLIDSGAPIELVIPPGTTGVEQFGGVVEDAQNPAAARLFMDYLLTVDGQQRLTDGLAASVLSDVPDAMELPAEYASPLEEEALAREADLNEALGL